MISFSRYILGLCLVMAFVGVTTYGIGYAAWGATCPDWFTGAAMLYGLALGWVYSMWALAKS